MGTGDPIFVAPIFTPEVMKRLKPLIAEVMKLIQSRTQTPEEAFTVLGAVTKRLALIHNIELTDGMDGQTGHS